MFLCFLGYFVLFPLFLSLKLAMFPCCPKPLRGLSYDDDDDDDDDDNDNYYYHLFMRIALEDSNQTKSY